MKKIIIILIMLLLLLAGASSQIVGTSVYADCSLLVPQNGLFYFCFCPLDDTFQVIAQFPFGDQFASYDCTYTIRLSNVKGEFWQGIVTFNNSYGYDAVFSDSTLTYPNRCSNLYSLFETNDVLFCTLCSQNDDKDYADYVALVYTGSMMTEIQAVLATAASNESDKANKDYKIGDVGPAGGYIFFDKGYYSDGWRYLEAAPSYIIKKDGKYKIYEGESYGWVKYEDKFPFGLYRNSLRGENLFVNGTTEYAEDNCTRSGIGEGKRNTELLVKAMKDKAYVYGSSKTTTEYIAKICYDFVYNGYSDWFLPSAEEVRLLMNELYSYGIGDYYNASISSSEWESDVEIVATSGIAADRSNGHRCIPVRRF